MKTTATTKQVISKHLCSKCGRTNIGKQELCLACNSVLGEQNTTTQAAASRPKFCTFCGTALKPDNLFCTGCGTKV